MAMMLRYSFDMDEAATQVEEAVANVLEKGYRTSDIYEEGKIRVGTEEMGSLILDEL